MEARRISREQYEAEQRARQERIIAATKRTLSQEDQARATASKWVKEKDSSKANPLEEWNKLFKES